ncbi:hypothetical protein HN446_04065 [bacterium]|jgi:hypothetical protein|nr:hypothetical protein [bacterium]
MNKKVLSLLILLSFGGFAFGASSAHNVRSRGVSSKSSGRGGKKASKAARKAKRAKREAAKKLAMEKDRSRKRFTGKVDDILCRAYGRTYEQRFDYFCGSVKVCGETLNLDLLKYFQEERGLLRKNSVELARAFVARPHIFRKYLTEGNEGLFLPEMETINLYLEKAYELCGIRNDLRFPVLLIPDRLDTSAPAFFKLGAVVIPDASIIKYEESTIFFLLVHEVIHYKQFLAGVAILEPKKYSTNDKEADLEALRLLNCCECSRFLMEARAEDEEARLPGFRYPTAREIAPLEAAQREEGCLCEYHSKKEGK